MQGLQTRYGAAWDAVPAGPRYMRRLLFDAEPGMVSKFEDYLSRGLSDCRSTEPPGARRNIWQVPLLVRRLLSILAATVDEA